MKIAIPTNDGLTVASEFMNAGECMVLTVSADKIVNEEIRRSLQDYTNLSKGQKIMMIDDCEFVVLNEADTVLCDEFSKSGIETVMTKEGIILNVVMEFVNDPHRKESNYCCCP